MLESGSKQMTKLSRFEATCLSSRERISECEEEGKGHSAARLEVLVKTWGSGLN